MDAPERIWTATTNGKCHVGFDTPSMNYTNEYIRADLAPDAALVAELVEAGNQMAASIEGNYYLPAIATRWRAVLAKLEGRANG